MRCLARMVPSSPLSLDKRSSPQTERKPSQRVETGKRKVGGSCTRSFFLVEPNTSVASRIGYMTNCPILCNFYMVTIINDLSITSLSTTACTESKVAMTINCCICIHVLKFNMLNGLFTIQSSVIFY